jgi:hypothetical protein
MDGVVSALLSLSFVALCLFIYAVTSGIRKVIEFVLDNPKVPTTKTAKWWVDVYLPISPILYGALFGWLATMYPYPEDFKTIWARIVFGVAAGALSGTAYRVVKSLVSKSIATTVNNVQ